jgi:hypothetical protein
MDSVRKAIYAVLSADEQLKELAHGIYHDKAPQDAKYPYVIFHRQAGTPVWAMSGRPAFKEEVWLVKGIARGEAADAAEDIDGRCEALLNDAALEVEGATTLFCLRESDMPSYSEADSAEAIFHRGGLYRVKIE